MTFNENGISVIVCCYNSAKRLPETLKALALQKVPSDFLWEIIIVNNASTDNTTQIASLEFEKYSNYNLNFKIIDEPLPGLSYARLKGISESKYKYLIFCDDDNHFFENYVLTAYNLMEAWPTTGIIGGLGLFKSTINPPEWFTKYAACYAIGTQSPKNGIMEGWNPGVFGAGMVVRKDALNKLHEKNYQFIATDRLGDNLSSGGDMELCYVLKLLGYEISYSDDLKFYHFMPENRLTDKYLLKLMLQFGYCDILHRPFIWIFDKSMPTYKKTFTWTFLISLSIYLHSLISLFNKATPFDKLVAKANFKTSKGRLWAIININWKIYKIFNSIKKIKTVI